MLLANGVRGYLVTDECRLARHALPLGILLNPDIGKTTGAHNSLSFLVILVPNRLGCPRPSLSRFVGALDTWYLWRSSAQECQFSDKIQKSGQHP